MKIESCISGWRLTEYDIKPFTSTNSCVISLKQIDRLSIRSAQWIFDHYYLVHIGNDPSYGCNYGVFMKPDDIMKVSIMENYPEYEKQLTDYFGEKWDTHYLRFNH